MDKFQTFDEKKMVFQNEDISYEEAYILNHSKIMSNEELISIVSGLLTEIIQETDQIQNNFLTQFHGKSVPQITVKDYLIRIQKASHCSQECFILALIYIDRITERNKNFLINSFNIHRLLITSIMLAAKFFDDRYYNNEYYSKIGGISNQEINQLEREFLHYINFRLYISPVLFFKYRQRLLQASELDMTIEN